LEIHLAVAVFLLAPAVASVPARADEIYLTEAEAPAAVFPEADRFSRRVVPSSGGLRSRVQTRLGKVKPTIWEKSYTVFTAFRGDHVLGRALIVDEIGKHRAITFIIGVEPGGTVSGVAVMAYREAYGGEVRSRRFLRQYEGKSANDALLPSSDIRNVTGATLSARAVGRGVKKAIAVLAEVEEGPS
jgi:Na+-translocating ferredoxin:NAD+ oxidoreductase RnfG subunit